MHPKTTSPTSVHSRYREGEAEKYIINNNSWIQSRVQKVGTFRFIMKLKPTIHFLFLIS